MKYPRLLTLLFFCFALFVCAMPASAQVYTQLYGITDDDLTKTGVTLRLKTREVAAAYTVTAKNDHTLLANATSAAFTISLPAAGTNLATKVLYIQKTDSTANAVTIDASGSETIDGNLTYVLSSQYQGVYLQAGFSGWRIIGVNGVPRVIVEAATTTLTADELYGSTIINTGAVGAVVYTLPAPKTGMRFRVYLNVAQDVDINAAASTQILALTNATGDAISSAATIGNCIELVALSSTTWGAFAVSGTWTDVN